jgi:hypothetical protein
MPLIFLLLSACVASTRTDQLETSEETQQAVPTPDPCGNPLRYPVSAACVSSSRFGMLLLQKSDLQMVEWRACPSENPCLKVPLPQLCQEPNNPSSQACTDAVKEANDQDYSCHAFANDPLTLQQSKAWQQCISERKCMGLFPLHPAGSAKKLATCFDSCGPSGDSFSSLPYLLTGAVEPPDDRFPQCTQAKANLENFTRRIRDAVLNAEMRKLGESLIQ